ncbi:2-aminoethylphosphonate ABC transporter substrate-binding protein [Trinickia caryophylli]|uniref:2-aminoethylphosphonate transport system substrate-binding protein n=1 Tax=Trinickia caryophylli TaxID=28094 RepID=A0A1X7EUB2_TRICW|nr:2-aminoethylphosphonate ABC transporter substrate-binding protein [Trinickia caryophylli]PMS12157.1 2-aminoethylphosphonate ABC transporter substrate-binding protein [Trinickia caryophylli]TRX18534.1 2-aminoethylphosphonate ABC transporter substrate-binding protein [Trinickia caryophylli]WQE10674.1 2-aminoethylphosphonate ABC transporter substrate-binding protein [Trinickia caryophylli]SMF40067.1 2-aminoethylphosphonate transport system substrate-binding protein [Trinickia caryophylli]GLU33
MRKDFRRAARGVARALAALSAFVALQAVVTAPAHAAGAVVLYTADGLENLYRDVLPAFEKKEGVKVNIVTAGSGEVVNRATIEKDAPKADVIVTLPPFIQQAQQTGLLQAYASPNYANVPAIAKAKDGMWATFVNNYFSFAVNPEVVKHEPKTFADLLHPDYTGKIAYSNPATAGDGMAVIILTTSLMGEDKAFDYLKKLEQSAKFHTKGTGYLDVLLSRNEIAVANGDLQMDLDDAANGGLSLKPIFLAAEAGSTPTTFQLPYAIGLVKNGPNQAAGRKLIDYLMSSEVQAKVPDVFGIPGRTDVPLAGRNGDAVKRAISGVRLIPVDWNQVMTKKADWTARWKRDVIGSSGKETELVKPKQ